MALVNVCNLAVLDNPTNFSNPFSFEITFECLQELEEDLEWKVIYVGKAASTDNDLVLDEILVGPIPVGINKFVMTADAPEASRLEKDEILGVTVVLVTCSYRDREFVRIGYYVNNEYVSDDPNYDAEKGPPSPLDLTKVTRHILADKPRITKFNIAWTKEDENRKPTSQNVAEESTMQLVGGADKGAAVAADAPGGAVAADTSMMEEDFVVDQDITNADQEEEEDEEEEEDGTEEADEIDLSADE